MDKNHSYIALALGAVGAALRRWQLATCFDTLGLPIMGVATPCLIALLIGSAMLFALVLHAPNALAWRADKPSILLKGSAALALLGGVLYFAGGNGISAESVTFQYAVIMLPLLMAVGCVAMAAGFWLLSKRGELSLVGACMVGFGSCFWLINGYRDHANDPVVLGFAFLILAVAACAVTWYQFSALAVGKCKSKLTRVLLLMSIVLCMTAAADITPLYHTSLFAAQVLALVGVGQRV